jgi:hypothetical protein
MLPLQVVVVRLRPWSVLRARRCPRTQNILSSHPKTPTPFNLFAIICAPSSPLPAPRFPRDDDLRVWMAVIPMDSAEAHSELPPLPLAVPHASQHVLA